MSGSLIRSKEKPLLRDIADEYVLSGTSPSGLRYKLAGSSSPDIGPVAGCPNNSTWPYNPEKARHCLYPVGYVLSVIADYERFLPDSDAWYWNPVIENLSAGEVREELLRRERVALVRELERQLSAREVA